MLLNQYGSEMETSHIKRAVHYIKLHPSVVIAAVPLVGSILSVLFSFIEFLYKKGVAIYFDVPDEYILIRNSLSLFGIVFTGIVFLAYSGIAVLTVRIWLRKERWVKRIGCTFLLPMLFTFIFMVVCTENPMLLLEFQWRDWGYLLWHTIIIVLFVHLPMVFGIGYCFVHPLNEDILQNKKKANKEMKKQLKKTRSQRDRLIFSVTWIAIVISAYFMAAMFMGYKEASEEREFNVVYIDEKLYISVMNDGDSLALKPGIYENKKLIIYGNENMMISSKGYLLKEMQYEKVTVTESSD